MKSTTERRTVKIELNFPLTEGEKDFVRHLLDTTASVEDNGGNGAPTLLAKPTGFDFSKLSAVPDGEAEAAPEPKAEAAPKARKSKPTKVEAAPEPVEADEPVDNDDTDYIELATDKAVELVEAKEKDAVRDALKAVGVKRVSEVKDQDTAKQLYEALIA